MSSFDPLSAVELRGTHNSNRHASMLFFFAGSGGMMPNDRVDRAKHRNVGSTLIICILNSSRARVFGNTNL